MYDLSQIQISYKYKVKHPLFLFVNRAGLVLQSVVRADTSFVRSKVDYTVATEAALHFTSDINFYGGVLMCMKLTQPEFSIRYNLFSHYIYSDGVNRVHQTACILNWFAFLKFPQAKHSQD